MSEDPTRRLPRQDYEGLRKEIVVLRDEVSELRARVSSLEMMVDARLHDSRPIWERVLAELEAIKSGQRATLARTGSNAD